MVIFVFFFVDLIYLMSEEIKSDVDLQTPLKRFDMKKGYEGGLCQRQKAKLFTNGYLDLTKERKCRIYYEVYGNGFVYFFILLF
jgi:hypothetical protein